MATRSTIAVVQDDGTVLSAYCHWDGYPEHNGGILCESYHDKEKTTALVKGGDMPSLDHDIEKINYYSKRGETGVEAKVFANIKEWYMNNQHEEYNYILLDGEWWCYTEHENDEKIVRNLPEKVVKAL